ncbi:MAG TPA: MFS transporter [Symbiobacteriaceae bacterium]|nr:MFS transporter [Symbiobacteriaceae bacterium]
MATKAKNCWLQLGALSGVPLLMVLGNSLLIPMLPQMGRVMRLSKSTTGLTITTFSLAAGIGIAFAGYAADKWGRKKVIIPSLILYGVGGIIAGCAGLFLGRGAFPLVMVGRVVQGLGAAGTAPVAMAFVGDLFQGQDRVTALGILEAANGLGKLLAPILGALIGLVFLWWVTFFIFAGLVIPIAALVLFLTQEVERKPAPPLKEYLGALGQLFKKEWRVLVSALWIGTVALAVLFALLFYLSQHLEEAHGIDGLPKGFWLAGPVGSMCVTSFITGIVLQKKPDLLKPLIGVGLGLILTGLLLMALLTADWALITGIIMSGVGTGLQLPGLNNLITSAAAAEQRGAVTALYGAVRFFGVAIGPPVVGLLMAKSERLPFWIEVALVVTAIIALFLAGPGKQKQQPTGRRPPGVPPWRPPEFEK